MTGDGFASARKFCPYVRTFMRSNRRTCSRQRWGSPILAGARRTESLLLSGGFSAHSMQLAEASASGQRRPGELFPLASSEVQTETFYLRDVVIGRRPGYVYAFGHSQFHKENWPVRVRNLVGTALNDCSCGSWLTHWRNFSGKPLTMTCVAIGCLGKAEVGAHVQRNSLTDLAWYIVPLCNACNAKTVPFDIADDTTLVSGNVSETCGKKQASKAGW